MTVVSSPLLTRVAGLPADVLDIVAPTTRELLSELATGSERLKELAPELIDMCFALVPKLDDDVPLRRRVLAGKRAINKLAPLPWDAEVHQRLHTWVTPEQSALVDTWLRLTDLQSELMVKLGAQLTSDRAAAVDGLSRMLESTGFVESLAIAAPDWIRHGRPQRHAESARSLKTLFSYVSRASVKTSPFSGLTTVGVAGTAGLGRARSRTSAVLAYHALDRIAHDERTAGLLRYRTARVRPGGRYEPGGLLLHGEVVITEGIIWRQDRVVEADYALSTLEELPADLAFDELLRSIGGERPFARFRRLLDSGLLHPVPPWEQREDPLLALARLVEDADSPISHLDLRLAHDLGAGACGENVQGRIDAATGIQQTTSGWAEHDGHGERKPSGLIYEDRESDLRLADPCEAPAVRSDLETLGTQMRPYIFRSHVYDFLVDCFLAEFGPGGTCHDPLGFLMRLTVDRDSNLPLERAMAADMTSRADPGERAWLPVGPTSAPPTAGVLFQLEAADYDDLAAGRHRLIVNHFSSGSGGLFSRFGALLGEDFRRTLAAHIERCWAGVSCRELVVWTECNTVQAECTGLLPPLLIPGEVGASDGITLDETVLTHDPEHGTLSLFDLRGAPVGLVYLGLIPQHLLQSYVRLLAVLADPWINASPHSDYTMTKAAELRAHCGDEVVALLRHTDGRVVTRRASWIVPVGAIPRPEAGDNGEADLAVRLEEFRKTHDLPEEVFVHQLGSSSFSMSVDRKPMWVSLASPLSVGILRQWLSPETGHIRMVEALPERHMHPQLDAQGRRRVTEHAALLYWPKGK